MSEYRAWLERRVGEVEREARDAGRAEAAWSWGRLAAFVGGAGLVVAGAMVAGWAVAVALGVAIAGFAVTLRRHQRVLALHDLARRRLEAMRESRRREGGRVVAVRANGRPEDAAVAVEAVGAMEQGPRWSLSGQERDDLDLYAPPVGLFGLINRTSTGLGAARLRDWLERPSEDVGTIAARQAAARWLAERDAERTDLAAGLIGVRGQDRAMGAFDEALGQARPVVPGAMLWLLRGWSALCLLVTFVAIYQAVEGDVRWATAVSVLAVVNCIVLAGTWPRARRGLGQWEAALDFASGYRDAAVEAAGALREAGGALGPLRDVLVQVADRDALPAVVRWTNWSVGGGWIYLMLNVLALWDLHTHNGIVRHAVPNRERLVRGMDAVAQLEAVLSLACFAREQVRSAFATVEDVVAGASTSRVGGVDVGGAVHPLIDPGKVVGNDVRLELRQGRNLWLITGSNMSGKSTFLRAVGVCALLAQVGSAVPAGRMRMGLVRLITDLRVRDDIGKGESYFLAEVRQLRRMIATETTEPIPVLGLVDEPFRGTNHQEQHAATLAIVEHLQRAPGLFLLATHDRELAHAAAASGVANYHFREDLHDGQLVFDYTLRDGVARTRNAIRVMEREGYPQDLVARAHAIVAATGKADET